MFTGFESHDFEVFDIPGLENRMPAIKTIIRPKLESLGQHFASYLSPLLGDEMYAHVAKHARRTVNPPDDTWVAFSANARGYKQHPHFQIGLWRTHVFAAFGYIYEATAKTAYGATLADEAAQVRAQIPEDYCMIPDHTRPDAIRIRDVDVDELRVYAERLQHVKKAELLIGKRWSMDDAVAFSPEAFVHAVEDVFTKLAFLYPLGRSISR